MHLTTADIELYINCPRSYKLRKLDGVAPQHKSLSLCKAITAKSVILALHQSVKPIESFTEEEIQKLCEETWIKEISDPNALQEELTSITNQAKPATKAKDATEPITKSQKILQEIQLWCTNYAKLESATKILYCDVRFEDTIGDTTFTGRIDLIRQDTQSGLEIVILKTSSTVPHPEYLAREFATSLAAHAVWQGKLYIHGLDDPVEFGVIPQITWYYLPHLSVYQKKTAKGQKGDLKGDPNIPVLRTEQSLREFEYEILCLAAGIEVGMFPMNVTHPCGCALCPYAYKCLRAAVKTALVPEYSEISL